MAFGVREALAASQIIWAERKDGQLYFRPEVEIRPGERCILVDDITLTSRTLKALAALVEEQGGQVLAAGVIVEPGLSKPDLGSIPFISLAQLEAESYPDGSGCPFCRAGQAATRLQF